MNRVHADAFAPPVIVHAVHLMAAAGVLVLVAHMIAGHVRQAAVAAVVLSNHLIGIKGISLKR